MIIEPSHYEYLSIQHGSIASEENLADFTKWKAAYENSLKEIVKNIRPALPAECGSILDIGGGLGGIDIVLAKYFKGAMVSILDGLDCPPHVHKHNLPFSNADVAKDFHRKNGNPHIQCIWPQPSVAEHYDLIVSFAAYGFHIDPEDYRWTLQNVVRPHTVMIFDVRKERPEWLKRFVQLFGQPTHVLHRAEKYVRLAFRGR